MGVSHQLCGYRSWGLVEAFGSNHALAFRRRPPSRPRPVDSLASRSLALSGLPIYVAASQRALLKQADVHTLLRLPTGILIRSLPLSQPSAFPSHSLLPANSGLRARSEGQRPLDSFAPAQSASRPARLVLRSQRIQVFDRKPAAPVLNQLHPLR